MDSEIKLRWITALRSGNYPQAKFHLNTTVNPDGGFCCLGVLCAIAEQDQVVIKSHRTNSNLIGYVSKVDSEDEHSAVPPVAVVEWSGISAQNPSFSVDVNLLPEGSYPSNCVVDGTLPTSLADLNDTYGLSFNQIADVIERYF